MGLTPAEKLEQRYPLAKELVERGEATAEVERAVELLLAGKFGREIAQEMGIGTSRALALLRDPDGSQAWDRRHRRHGICRSCGEKTYSGGAVEVPEHCSDCAPEVVKEKTRERVIAAIRDWNDRYGTPPTGLDWNVPMAVAKAHPERLALIRSRHAERGWPGVTTAQAAFGSWNAAIEAAGLKPTLLGQRQDPETWRQHVKDAWKGRTSMPSPKEVIAREIEKNNERRERLKAQIDQIDADNRQLTEAQKVIDRMPETAAA